MNPIQGPAESGDPGPEASPNRTRDHLANERTFLAWVRTSLALIGLGFVLARMGLFLRQIAAVAPEAIHGSWGHPGHEFVVTGIVFLVLGTAMAAWAGLHYRRSLRTIEARHFEPDTRATGILTVLVVLGGLVIVGLVLWSVGFTEDAGGHAASAPRPRDRNDPAAGRPG